MPLSHKKSHLNSDEHKNDTKQQLVWCEDCDKYISDKTRHFQSENHINRSLIQKSQHQQQQKNFSQDVKIIVNEKTYMKPKKIQLITLNIT